VVDVKQCNAMGARWILPATACNAPAS